jgi:methionine aminopeptidase
MGVVIKSPEEVAAMREAGRIVAKVLETLAGEVKPGVKARFVKEILYPSMLVSSSEATRATAR